MCQKESLYVVCCVLESWTQTTRLNTQRFECTNIISGPLLHVLLDTTLQVPDDNACVCGWVCVYACVSVCACVHACVHVCVHACVCTTLVYEYFFSWIRRSLHYVQIVKQSIVVIQQTKIWIKFKTWHSHFTEVRDVKFRINIQWVVVQCHLADGGIIQQIRWQTCQLVIVEVESLWDRWRRPSKQLTLNHLHFVTLQVAATDVSS